MLGDFLLILLVVTPLYIFAVWGYLQRQRATAEWEARLQGVAVGLMGAGFLHSIMQPSSSECIPNLDILETGFQKINRFNT